MRNTINVNGILYGIRHIPIIGRHISERIYGIRVFKIIALIMSIGVEIARAFFGPLCLFGFLFIASGMLSSLNDYARTTVYLFGFLLILIIENLFDNLFGITEEARYLVFFLGMDAGKFIHARLLYKTMALSAAYVLFGIPTALFAGVEWYIALLLPVSAIGLKVFALGLQMLVYSLKDSAGKLRNGKDSFVPISGNAVVKTVFMFLLLGAGGVASPFVVFENRYLPLKLCMAVFAVLLIPGIFLVRRFPYGLYRIAMFGEYSQWEINRKYYGKNKQKNKKTGKISRAQVKSGLSGFNYLNEIFLKRYSNLFIGRMVGTVIGVAGVIALMSIYFYFELSKAVGSDTGRLSESLLRLLFTRRAAVFTLVLYFINSGGYMARAMFANCDSALLVFGFYKAPKAILTMFRLRVLSVIRYNLLPAVLMAVYSIVIMAMTGGEDYPLQYLFTVLTIMIALVFYSVWNLTIYYLIQPFTSDLLIRSKLYEFLSVIIGVIGFILIVAGVSARWLTIAGLVITVPLIIFSNILIYRFAPKTFKLR
ncbi:MAG: hypothetical protein IJ796_10270 [Lachnospiraceae bacterium]|nr:hypothetical protein [Lachnospiraceae bacterium]